MSWDVHMSVENDQTTNIPALVLDLQPIYGDRPIIEMSNSRLKKIATFFGVSISTSEDGRQYKISQDSHYKEDMTEQARSALKDLHEWAQSQTVYHPSKIRDGQVLQDIFSKHQSNSRVKAERTTENETPENGGQTMTHGSKRKIPSFNSEAAATISRADGISLASLNGYLSRQNRDRFLKEFEVQMHVRVEANDRGSFDVMMPIYHEGPVHTNLTNKIAAALGYLQEKLDQDGNFNRMFVQKTINLAVGDKLAPKFAKEAAPEPLPAVVTPVISPTGRFVCPVRFNLPLFDESGYLAMTSTSGRPKEWQLTINQRAYKDALFDPEKKLIIAHGVAGSAKTDIMLWCGLRQLQLGTISKIYYERPMVAIDDIDPGALPGDLNKKTGPYASVIVNKIIEWLANGDRKKGEKVFNELQSRGCLEQYNGMMKNGDTIYDAILLVDEAQNKSMNELYHLATRAGDGAKIVISGDFEFQNSLTRKRQSGFRDFVEMTANVPLAQAIEMQESDCKRSELTQQIYMARKAFEEAKAAREQSFSGQKVVPLASMRGPN